MAQEIAIILVKRFMLPPAARLCGFDFWGNVGARMAFRGRSYLGTDIPPACPCAIASVCLIKRLCRNEFRASALS